MQQGIIFRATIEDLGQGGEGIAKIDGLTVFVPDVVLGDVIELELIELKKNYALGRLKRLLKPSPDRVVSPCPDFPECGGCQLLTMAYPAQLAWKERHLAEVLRRIGDIEPVIDPIIGMDQPWHYRNKMTYPVNRGKLGLYQRSSHHIVEISDCQVHPPAVGEVLEIIRRHLERGLSSYDEIEHRGGLRHVMIRYAFERNQMMVVLVTCDKTDLSALLNDLSQLSAITTIVENKNCTRGNRILGDKNIVHYGAGVIEEDLADDVFLINPHSFYQVNTIQLKKLYRTVSEMADLKGHELVYDIYAGLGTIGSYLSRRAGRVVSIEVVPQAIQAGLATAKLNQRHNMEFILGKAEDVMATLNQQGQKPDLVVVDPPRKGLDNKLIDSLLAVKPDKLIYVSCKPSTLARDLKKLSRIYQVGRIQPVDLFPHTTHVETVVLMSRVEK